MDRAEVIASVRRDRGHHSGERSCVVRNLEAETEPTDPAIGSPLAHEVVWPMWETMREHDDPLDSITIGSFARSLG